jgi:hypothetical protein
MEHDVSARIAARFKREIATIETRDISEPSTWECYNLFHALTAIEDADLERAEEHLIKVHERPDGADLITIWNTPSLKLAEITAHFQRVQWALP